LVARKLDTSGIANSQKKRIVPTRRHSPMIRNAFTRDRDCLVDFRMRGCVSQRPSVLMSIPRYVIDDLGNA
jgi:replicative DNA helicase